VTDRDGDPAVHGAPGDHPSRADGRDPGGSRDSGGHRGRVDGRNLDGHRDLDERSGGADGRDPDREDGGAAAPHDPAPGAGEVAHRVVRLADLAGSGPRAPVASLRGLGPDEEPSPVVDLRAWARGGDPAPGRRRARPRTFVDAPPPADRAQGGRGAAARPARHRGPGSSGAGGAREPVAAPPVRRLPPPPLEDPQDAVATPAERRVPRAEAADGRKAGGRRAARERQELEADPVAAAREICLRLLTERARTRQELAQALRKREVPDEAADAVLERFDEVGLIDDAAFAGQWVRSRHTGRGLARRAIAFELRRKGVADEVAQEALAEVDTAAEEQRARELVDRKLRTIPADTPERRTKAAGRLVGMLARRGYPGGIAYRVVREALAAHGAELDELGEPDL
jgi:regulatory protein